MIQRIVLRSGSRRLAFDLLPSREARAGYAEDIRRLLFPANGSYFKHKRRGARAIVAHQARGAEA